MLVVVNQLLCAFAAYFSVTHLCTNQLHVLPQCDRVLVLKDGQMVELGKYKDLMRIPDGVMRGLIEAYGTNGDDDEEDDG